MKTIIRNTLTAARRMALRFQIRTLEVQIDGNAEVADVGICGVLAAEGNADAAENGDGTAMQHRAPRVRMGGSRRRPGRGAGGRRRGSDE